jgi:glyoxylase-like metal-dependent hydrolase (beta-lactamase superfamily II)
VPGVPVPGNLDVQWIHGSASAKHNTDPDIQVHAYDQRTYILRQNKAVNYEAPFMFLLFGDARAVLIDTGATESAEYFPLRQTVDGLVDRWLAGHPRLGYRLLVLHTHAHGDHVAADGQFAGRPDTLVVAAERAPAWEFFGFGDDLGAVAGVDLGGRVLECLPTPGHHEAAVTFYDPCTGLLLTGDTVYPGRLYIQDWEAFAVSIDRIAAFAATREVTHILGCHVEMSNRPGIDYPVRTTYQPRERPLPMTVAQLADVRFAVGEAYGRPGRHVFDDFILVAPDLQAAELG